ncbi:MAG: leucine-rich repeat domain-containing protein [Clostridia bacterium]|nr:leucine-rich repeat domain-containing protein [Clostridia bacterium]
MNQVKCETCGSTELKMENGVWVCEICGSTYTEFSTPKGLDGSQKTNLKDIPSILRLIELEEYSLASSELHSIIINGCNDPIVFLLKLMSDNKVYSSDYLVIASIKDFKRNPLFKAACRYADPELLAFLNDLKEEKIEVPTAIIEDDELKEYTGNDETYTVPDGVKIIGRNAFSRAFKTKKVILPQSVTEIRDYAFDGCALLEEINLEGVESIGNFAFKKTKLKKAIFSDKIEFIGSWVFESPIEHIELPFKDIVFDDDDYMFVNSDRLKYIKAPLCATKKFSESQIFTTLEICEGEVEIYDEQFIGKYSCSTIVFPSTLKNFYVSLASTYFKVSQLVFKSSSINIQANYFLQNQEIKHIEANNNVLKAIENAYPYHTATTKNAIRNAYIRNGASAPSSSSSSSSSSNHSQTATSSGGCYVATCVYGSYDCPQVWTLRRYRDDTLASTWYGRLFIRTYYAVSPTLVKWFGNTNWFKKLWKDKLDRMVAKLQINGVEDTPYEDKTW